MALFWSGFRKMLHPFDDLDDALLALAVLVAGGRNGNSELLRVSEQRMTLGGVRRLTVKVQFDAHGRIKNRRTIGCSPHQIQTLESVGASRRSRAGKITSRLWSKYCTAVHFAPTAFNAAFM